MKKISSKFILSLLLAIFLWSGAGFNLDIQKVFAQTATPSDCSAEKAASDKWGSVETTKALEKCLAEKEHREALANCKPDNPRYQECIDAVNQAEKSKNEPQSSYVWDGIVDTIKVIVKGPLYIAMSLIAGMWQLIIIPILGVLVKLSASVLDEAVKYTLDTTNITSITEAITTVWIKLRDFFNVTFIFILLYTAIKTIIGSQDSNTKKMIIGVIKSAILINFSLFITRIMIDFGNLLAVNFYNLATNDGSQPISAIISNVLGIGKFWASPGVDFTPTSPTFFVVTTIQTMAMITTFVILLYISLLMIGRTVALIFIMASSPIGFMGDILPKLSEYSKMWWDNLRGQIIVAPVFLFFFYLITIIGKNGNFTISGSVSSSADFMAFFKFILIIVLLSAALKITKKSSGVIGDMIGKYGTMASGLALGAMTGGAAVLARQTIGRYSASQLAGEKGDALRARAAAGDQIAMAKLAYHEKASTATFDARNTKAMGQIMGGVNSVTGLKVDLGKAGGTYGAGTGFKGAQDEQQNRINKTYNELNASVTNKQRLAANTAKNKRDTAVENHLETATTTEATDYRDRKAQKKDLLNVDINYTSGKDFEELRGLRENTRDEEEELERLRRIGADAKDIAQANRNIEAAKKAVKAKEKELQEELKKKYAGEIAQLDQEMKKIRGGVEKQVETGKIRDSAGNEVLNDDEKAKLDIINKARNYADSVRQGRTGEFTSANKVFNRSKELADAAESQKESK